MAQAYYKLSKCIYWSSNVYINIHYVYTKVCICKRIRMLNKYNHNVGHKPNVCNTYCKAHKMLLFPCLPYRNTGFNQANNCYYGVKWFLLINFLYVTTIVCIFCVIFNYAYILYRICILIWVRCHVKINQTTKTCICWKIRLERYVYISCIIAIITMSQKSVYHLRDQDCGWNLI